MPANLENSTVAKGLEKVSFHSNPKERQCQRIFKLLHNALISHASKVKLKILQARLQQYVNYECILTPENNTGFSLVTAFRVLSPAKIAVHLTSLRCPPKLC